MIYQCFFREEQREKLFAQDCYAPFGLEPAVNAAIGQECPELLSATNRMALTEYAACLWHSRNRDANPDRWIGFTSWRQLDKSVRVFRDRLEIEELLGSAGHAGHGFGWGYATMHDRSGKAITLAEQCELLHPGLLELAADLVEIPAAFSRETGGFFANYWVLPLAQFEDYIAYSLPVARKALEVKAHPGFGRQRSWGTVSREKFVGYLMERVFIFWYLKNKLTLANVGVARRIINNPLNRAPGLL